MLAHTKTHLISSHKNAILLTHGNDQYVIPKKIANKYLVKEKSSRIDDASVSSEKAFEHLVKKFTKAGSLLRGLRTREGLSQLEFAKKLHITQPNLSSMENGKRPIGKDIAKRIEKIFGTDYRYFLE